MKKYIFVLSNLFLPIIAFAHEEDMFNMDMHEGTTFWDQLNELLPLMHIQEGHYITVVFLILMWVAVVYTVYSLVSKFRKAPKQTSESKKEI